MKTLNCMFHNFLYPFFIPVKIVTSKHNVKQSMQLTEKHLEQFLYSKQKKASWSYHYVQQICNAQENYVLSVFRADVGKNCF